MTGLYIFLIVFYILYKSYLIWGSKTYETSLWNELPLALCQVASFLVLPGILKKNNTILCFCFFIGSICSLMAILMPVEGFYNIPLLSFESIGFYGFHGLVFIQAICLVTLGFYKPKVKDVPKAMLLLAVIALIVHFINMWLRATVLPDSNYFFTYSPENNPALGLCYKFIPVSYVYLLPLLVPLGLVLSLIAFIFQKLDKKSRK